MKYAFWILLFLHPMLCSAQTSYAARFFTFSSQGQPVKMAYIYEKAVASSGKTIILLHGKNFSFLYWNKVIDALLHKGFDVLAPDQIGFGMSSMPVAYQFSFQQLALNTHMLADSLGIKKSFVLGHSIGGMLAIRYALMYPSDCHQLLLEDPIGLEDWKINIPYTQLDISYQAELKKAAGDLKKYMQANYFHQQWKSSYDTLLEQSSINLGNKNAAWCMALTSDMMYTQPVFYELSKIRVSTVLIVGSLDKTAPGKEKAPADVQPLLGNYPKLARAAASIIPHCKLFIMDGIGHIPHEEDLPEFMKILSAAIQ